MVKFAKFTAEEQDHVVRIVDRAVRMFRSRGEDWSPQDVLMDISAVHARVPLRLRELSEADDANFGHDIGGIARHLNRETGELEDFFMPRFAAPSDGG